MGRMREVRKYTSDKGNNETLGERIARIRNDRGYAQIELAEKNGIIQSIVSAIERDVLKLSEEMAVRFGRARLRSPPASCRSRRAR